MAKQPNTMQASPTTDLLSFDRSEVLESSAPIVHAYSFRDDDAYTIFVLSLQFHSNTSVRLNLPFNSATNLMRFSLSGDPRTNNAAGPATPIMETALGVPAISNRQFDFVLPPSSVYAYRFEGVVPVAAATNPVPIIRRAPGQFPTSSLPVVEFSVTFDQPVSPLLTGNIVVGGDAVVSEVEVVPITGSLNMAFRVLLNGIENSGVVCIELPAGAVMSTNGQPSLAVSGQSLAVTYVVPPAQDLLQAYDELDPGPGTNLLFGWNTGFGWATPWLVQNASPAMPMPGFHLATHTPLRHHTLLTEDAYAVGGMLFLTAGRVLDVPGAFPRQQVYQSDPPVIGQSGTEVWMSCLLRREQLNDREVAVRLVDDYAPQNLSASQVGAGFFGADSTIGGTGYWSLLVVNEEAGTMDIVPSATPAVVGETVFLVARMTFGAQDETALYINPTNLGSAVPPVPDVVHTTTGTTTLAFRTLAYRGGDFENEASLDSIRLGDSYAAVTPSDPFKIWQLMHWPTLDEMDAAPGADPDGDGSDNHYEYITDTIPTDAGSLFSLYGLTVSNQVIIGFGPTSSNRIYSLETSTNLNPSIWQPVPGRTNLPGQQSLAAALSDTNA
ncbi:MAG: hypothetical protein AAF492_15030, partial [Verrucomicrobiota bacterium]